MKTENTMENGTRTTGSQWKMEEFNGGRRRVNGLGIREVEPWEEAVDGKELLDELADVLTRFVVLPRYAAQTLALWVVHTYAFELRDVSTYIGIESPEKRCGKTTLLAVLSELVCRPVVAANISSPAFFRVIEELRPTLLIDEADTFLQGNDELRGILNSGYARSTARVIRVSNEQWPQKCTKDTEDLNSKSEIRTGTSGAQSKQIANSNGESSQTEDRTEKDDLELRKAGKDGRRSNNGSRLASFSCWCPKVMAAIGRLPDTLADRCVVIRMHRKSAGESCERLRLLEAEVLRRKCARFVMDHRDAIATARPQVPGELNDRAADIWEPLLVLADLAGWPQKGTEGGEDFQPQMDTDEHGSGTEENEGNEGGSGIDGREAMGEGQNNGKGCESMGENGSLGERTLPLGNKKNWAVVAREAAVCLTGVSQENHPIGSLLMDILFCFSLLKGERVFSRTLVQNLNCMRGRPWNELTRRRTKEAPLGVTEVWLARVLRPYGVRPATMRIGEAVAKGYSMEDFTPVFRRYIPLSEVEDMRARMEGKSPEQVEREEAEKKRRESEGMQLGAFARLNEMAKLAKGLAG